MDSKTHIPALTGFRGLGILMVLLYHCFFTFHAVGIKIAWIGVDIFFVLSGYLITNSLINDKRENVSLLKFYTKRALRILPLYFLILVSAFFVVPRLFPSSIWSPYTFLLDHQFWYWIVAPNWLVTLGNGWPPVPKPILDHFWFLGVICNFYLCWPLFVKYCNEKILLSVSVFLVLFSVSLRFVFVEMGLNYTSSYACTLARLDGIFLGAIVSLLYNKEGYKLKISKIAPYTLAFSMAVLVILAFVTGDFSLKNSLFIEYGYFFIALFWTCVLIFILDGKNLLQRIMANKTLLFFGKYSYGIFVFHWIIYPLTEFRMSLFLETIVPKGAWTLTSFVCSFIIIAMAMLSYHLIEKPIMRFRAKEPMISQSSKSG